MVGEKCTDGEVIEFLPVVGLYSIDGTTELYRHIGEKGEEGGGNVRFPTKRKGPHKMRVVIENNKIV